MGRVKTVEAIVLRTYDVGDADKFCILFTHEQGLLPARAKGVRKLGSRIGGNIIPPMHSTIELRETSTGHMITSAKQMEHQSLAHLSVHQFLALQSATELLLQLLHEDEPLPDVFDLFIQFSKEPSLHTMQGSLWFCFGTLSLLGMLPSIENTASFGKLDSTERAFVESAIQQNHENYTELSSTQYAYLHALSDRFLHNQLSRPLRCKEMASSLLATPT